MDVGILCGGSGDSTTNQVYAVIRTKIEKSISLISVKESRAHFFHFFFSGGTFRFKFLLLSVFFHNDSNEFVLGLHRGTAEHRDLLHHRQGLHYVSPARPG
jgi:hypothetical protein